MQPCKSGIQSTIVQKESNRNEESISVHLKYVENILLKGYSEHLSISMWVKFNRHDNNLW